MGHWACYHGREKLLKIFIGAGMDIESSDKVFCFFFPELNLTSLLYVLPLELTWNSVLLIRTRMEETACTGLRQALVLKY